MFLRDLTEPIDSGTSATQLSSALLAVNQIQTILDTQTTQSTAQSRVLNQSPVNQYSSNFTFASTSNHSASSHNNLQSNPIVAISGTVLYDFQAESKSELSLKEGQVVTNITIIDDDWWQGTVDGASGMFPKTFVELSDAPSSKIPSKAIQTMSSKFPTASVLYDFTAVNSEEISLSEGQQVFIVTENIDDWTKVRTSDGSEGLCPTDFLDRPTSNIKTDANNGVPTTNGVVMREKSAGDWLPIFYRFILFSKLADCLI